MWGEVRQRARSWNASNMCIAKSVSRLIGLDLLLVSFSTHRHLNAVHSTRSTRYCVPGFSLLPQLNYYGIDCNLQRALLFILWAHDSFCASDSRLFVVCVCVLFLLLPFPYCFVYSFLSFHSEAFDSLWSIKSEKIELSNLSILYDLKIQPEKRMAVYCTAYNSSTELIIYCKQSTINLRKQRQMPRHESDRDTNPVMQLQLKMTCDMIRFEFTHMCDVMISRHL